MQAATNRCHDATLAVESTSQSALKRHLLETSAQRQLPSMRRHWSRTLINTVSGSVLFFWAAGP